MERSYYMTAVMGAYRGKSMLINNDTVFVNAEGF